MHHYRKTKQAYTKLNAADAGQTICTLCNENNQPRIIAKTDTMFIMPNRVAYDMFEGRRVVDHLMVIPRRHVEVVSEFTTQEKIDQVTIMGEYEALGYDAYARGAGSVSRSVRHQHTHLIKMLDKKAKLIIYTEKPHLLLDL